MKLTITLATGPDEGRDVVVTADVTATVADIAERLRGQTSVTRLASGLPVGADLEHADEVTLGKALAGRRIIE